MLVKALWIAESRGHARTSEKVSGLTYAGAWTNQISEAEIDEVSNVDGMGLSAGGRCDCGFARADCRCRRHASEDLKAVACICGASGRLGEGRYTARCKAMRGLAELKSDIIELTSLNYRRRTRLLDEKMHSASAAVVRRVGGMRSK